MTVAHLWGWYQNIYLKAAWDQLLWLEWAGGHHQQRPQRSHNKIPSSLSDFVWSIVGLTAGTGVGLPSLYSFIGICICYKIPPRAGEKNPISLHKYWPIFVCCHFSTKTHHTFQCNLGKERILQQSSRIITCHVAYHHLFLSLGPSFCYLMCMTLIWR